MFKITFGSFVFERQPDNQRLILQIEKAKQKNKPSSAGDVNYNNCTFGTPMIASMPQQPQLSDERAAEYIANVMNLPIETAMQIMGALNQFYKDKSK